MRIHHDKTWACHEDPTKACAGAIQHLKKAGFPYTQKELVTETDAWDEFTKPLDKQVAK